jgi:hypothetical protein
MDTRAKIKVNEMVKSCPMDMNGLNTRGYLKIFPLGSYEFLIRMDWLDQNHAILDCHNKAFTFLDGEGNLNTIQGIRREITIRENLNNAIEEKLEETMSNICSPYGRDIQRKGVKY